MTIRKITTLALILALLSLVPPAEARPVCTYQDVFVAKATPAERAYSCDLTFDAVLVETGSPVAGSALEVCTKNSSGFTLTCKSGCSFVMLTGLSNVAYITVKQPLINNFAATCTPLAGTITVQFGDTRDGGSF